jgi:ubiquinone/menaquinone biosynthesis C-methylase UbiE
MTDQIVDDQIAYYRQRAEEYDVTAYGGDPLAAERIARIVSTFPDSAATLELACGTGMWTAALAQRPGQLTAVDAAPEAIAIARRRCPDAVAFVCADVLSWLPEARYDLIFFGFWLSHVPTALRPDFFGRLRRSLTLAGHVVFVDEPASQAGNEQPTDHPEIVERTLIGGSTHRLVKVFVNSDQIIADLAGLGWHCEIVPDGPDWVIGTATALTSGRD